MGRLLSVFLAALPLFLAACGKPAPKVEVAGLEEEARGTAYRLSHQDQDLDMETAAADAGRLIERADSAVFRDCEICPEMVAVSGADSSAAGKKPVAIGRTEITVEDWDGCVADGACVEYQPIDGGRRHDVVAVGLRDVESFVAWLTRKSGKDYRVCTDIEWKRLFGRAPGKQVGFRVARDLE